MGFTFLARFFPGDDALSKKYRKKMFALSAGSSIPPQLHVVVGVTAMLTGHFEGEYKFQWWAYVLLYLVGMAGLAFAEATESSSKHRASRKSAYFSYARLRYEKYTFSDDPSSLVYGHETFGRLSNGKLFKRGHAIPVHFRRDEVLSDGGRATHQRLSIEKARVKLISSNPYQQPGQMQIFNVAFAVLFATLVHVLPGGAHTGDGSAWMYAAAPFLGFGIYLTTHVYVTTPTSTYAQVWQCVSSFRRNTTLRCARSLEESAAGTTNCKFTSKADVYDTEDFDLLVGENLE